VTPPRLLLPLLPRRGIVEDLHATPRGPKPHNPVAALPPQPSVATAPSAAAAARLPRGTALRSGRPLPARLQALDDQTVMPKEVYNRMLRLGDEARGRLGYAQHRLAFTGPNGTQVLRLVEAA